MLLILVLLGIVVAYLVAKGFRCGCHGRPSPPHHEGYAGQTFASRAGYLAGPLEVFQDETGYELCEESAIPTPDSDCKIDHRRKCASCV
jgi:hypothetical protein